MSIQDMCGMTNLRQTIENHAAGLRNNQTASANGLSFLPRVRGTNLPIKCDAASVEEAIRVWSKQIQDSSGIVVPFGFVRMFELRSNVNDIVNSVCHYLSRVLESLQIDITSQPAPWRSFHNEMASESSWRRLSASLAARTGDHRSRRRHLDMEAYAVEAEEVSRQIMEFPNVFDNFIESLASDFHAACLAPQAPIFVFAVSEVYDRLDELEKAMRVLDHRRLIFLLSQ